MQNLILFLILLTICNSTFSQSNIILNHKLPQQRITQKSELQKLNLSEHPLQKQIGYYYINGSWEKNLEKVFEYNETNHILKTTEHRLSARYNEFTLFYTVDFNYYELKPNLLKEQISVRYDDWDPTRYFKTLYFYNENDSLSERIHQMKDDSIWTNIFREVFVYSNNGMWTQLRLESWEENTWITSSTYETVNYDSNLNLIEAIQKNCFGGECDEQYRNIWEYDSQNYKIKYLHQWMQATGWENFSQNLYEYNKNSKISLDLFQHWNSNNDSWDNTSKKEYYYSLNSNLISITSSRWDYYAQNPGWIYSQRHSYRYQDGYRIEELYEVFDQEWKKQSKAEYYYEGITNIVEDGNSLKRVLLFHNFPNPFNPTTKIKYTISSNLKREMINVKLVVYDVLGKEIITLVNQKQPSGKYEVEFSANDLTSGIYFYRLKVGNFVETKKMILMR